MIQFSDPPLGMTISQYMELVNLWTACSSCVGFSISLGKFFFAHGVEEVDTVILPAFADSVEGSASPRVLPSYSILYWFASQVGFLAYNSV